MILTVGASLLLVLCLLGMSFLIFRIYQEHTGQQEQGNMLADAKQSGSETVSVEEEQEDPQQQTTEDGQESSSQQEQETVRAEEDTANRAEELIENMTLEEKVAQLFFVLPDSLAQVSGVTQVGETTASAYREYPVGGIVYMEGNLVSEEQLTGMNESFRQLSQEILGVGPFLAVDEEGGSVVRIAGNEAFPVANVGDMADIGSTQDSFYAYQAGITLGSYLHQYGFNLDFAPVADALTNPSNTVV